MFSSLIDSKMSISPDTGHPSGWLTGMSQKAGKDPGCPSTRIRASIRPPLNENRSPGAYGTAHHGARIGLAPGEKSGLGLQRIDSTPSATSMSPGREDMKRAQAELPRVGIM